MPFVYIFALLLGFLMQLLYLAALTAIVFPLLYIVMEGPVENLFIPMRFTLDWIENDRLHQSLEGIES